MGKLVRGHSFCLGNLTTKVSPVMFAALRAVTNKVVQRSNITPQKISLVLNHKRAKTHSPETYSLLFSCTRLRKSPLIA